MHNQTSILQPIRVGLHRRLALSLLAVPSRATFITHSSSSLPLLKNLFPFFSLHCALALRAFVEKNFNFSVDRFFALLIRYTVFNASIVLIHSQFHEICPLDP